MTLSNGYFVLRPNGGSCQGFVALILACLSVVVKGGCFRSSFNKPKIFPGSIDIVSR